MHAYITPESQQKPLADLIAILKRDQYKGDKLATAITNLREATDGCPACMFAAIRQSGLNRVDDESSEAFPFEFKIELEKFRQNVNNERYENSRE